MSKQEGLGSYKITVKDNKKSGRSKHEALLEIKTGRVKIKRSGNLPATVKTKSYVELTALEIKEDTSTVKPGEPPVHWVLLTTERVKDFAEAKEIVRKYSLRWQIEQLFRISKKQGLDVESSQIETGEPLMKLCFMALHVAMKVLQLTQARDSSGDLPAELAFTSEQVDLLEKVEKRYEGKTEKQRTLM